MLRADRLMYLRLTLPPLAAGPARYSGFWWDALITE